MHHAFLYISLLPLHDYDVKMPNFTFYYIEDVNTRQQFPFSSPELQYRPLKFNSRKMLHYLLNWMTWNKWRKVWRRANSLLKWRFCSGCCCCCLSFLLLQGLLLNFNIVLKNSTPEKFAIICWIEQDGITEVKFEAERINLWRDVFVVIAVIVA